MSASSPIPVIPGSRAPHGIARGLIPGGQREEFSPLCFDVWTCCGGGGINRFMEDGGWGLLSLGGGIEWGLCVGGRGGREDCPGAQRLQRLDQTGWPGSPPAASLRRSSEASEAEAAGPARDPGGAVGLLWVCCGRGIQSAWGRREGGVDGQTDGRGLSGSRAAQARPPSPYSIMRVDSPSPLPPAE